jgi:hypothetical protein
MYFWAPIFSGARGAISQHIGPLEGGASAEEATLPSFLQIHFMSDDETRLHRRREVSGLDQLANRATINEVLELVEHTIRDHNPDYAVFQQAHARFHGIAEIEREVIVVDAERLSDQPQHGVNVSGEVAAILHFLPRTRLPAFLWNC